MRAQSRGWVGAEGHTGVLPDGKILESPKPHINYLVKTVPSRAVAPSPPFPHPPLLHAVAQTGLPLS